MTLIGSDGRCARCGCAAVHRQDSTHPVRWCGRCGAGCWHDTQPPVVPITCDLEPFGRVITSALNYLNSWLGAAIRL